MAIHVIAFPRVRTRYSYASKSHFGGRLGQLMGVACNRTNAPALAGRMKVACSLRRSWN